MAEETRIEAIENEVPQKTRRTFVKTAAQVAVTAPAVAVLLSAGTKPAAAIPALYLTGDGTPLTAEHTGSFNGSFDDEVAG